MSKPVEVWCVVAPEGFPLDHGGNEGETWADLCQKLGQSQAYLERVGYRCERRLLVREGETWQDGVAEAARLCEQRADSIRLGSAIARQCAKDIRALSPQPKDEATELLRHLRMTVHAPDVGIELCNEVDTYLKGRT